MLNPIKNLVDSLEAEKKELQDQNRRLIDRESRSANTRKRKIANINKRLIYLKNCLKKANKKAFKEKITNLFKEDNFVSSKT